MTSSAENENYSWWGPPKKFSTNDQERKISWLELFFDLVYVIAISTITHEVALHFSVNALLVYFYLFVIIFWGWLNGSLYYDLHGTEGLRTKLMTLWQILIIAALVITLRIDPAHAAFNSTIVLLIMQIYITYLWWSVGFYDKDHRKLNVPYTLLYLVSFACMLATLFVSETTARILFYLTLLFNILPPFLSYFLQKGRISGLILSSSMTERLGLFTTIVFGELMLGVINGVIALNQLNTETWWMFIISTGIVFALWWLFFTVVSDRRCKGDLLNSSIFELLFIPTLIGLGMLGATFSDLFKSAGTQGIQAAWIMRTFGYSISIFLLGISAMMPLLM
ncbi:MAG: low temperature requirement protein A, partial [Bacteroidota bacterium]